MKKQTILVTGALTGIGRATAIAFAKEGVNSAGTEGTAGSVLDQSSENYAETFDTNVLGVVLSMKHELRAMKAQGRGSVVNIFSTLGKVGARGASIYVASRHSVEGLTKAAAVEAASFGVRVNAIAPGPTETAMLNRFTGQKAEVKEYVAGLTVLKRVATTDEIAHAIVFVDSDKASFVTDRSFSVDGGRTTG